MNEQNEPKITVNQNGDLAFTDPHYEGVRKHVLYLEQDLVEEKAKVRYLNDKVEILREINKANEHIKGFEKAWWFTAGFLSFFIVLFLCALIFGERVAS